MKLYCKELDRQFDNKSDMLKALVENMDSIVAAKKAITKHADGFGFISQSGNSKAGINKADAVSENATELNVTAIINTTNILDSHGDVHIDGLWKKSLAENKMMLHLQEHEMEFKCIISDGADLKAYTQKFTWKELGYNYEGETEALVFESRVKASRNGFMFDQYRKGYVRNHSVGMRYVKLVMCINSEEEWAGAYKEAWDKYYPLIVNKEDADMAGYFWAVKEAKAIEGSAVPIGSNRATPTQSVTEAKEEEDAQIENKEENNQEAAGSTSGENKDSEPSQDTQVKIKQTIKSVTEAIQMQPSLLTKKTP